MTVPEWPTKDSAAVIDVFAGCHAYAHDLYIDVTARHPAATGYTARAAKTCGVACWLAAEQKRKRCPTKCGLR
eukprot:8567541-Lingulodinium_polyedra.AAC.1